MDSTPKRLPGAPPAAKTTRNHLPRPSGNPGHSPTRNSCRVRFARPTMPTQWTSSSRAQPSGHQDRPGPGTGPTWLPGPASPPRARSPGISLTGVRVVNGEANRHAAYPRACSEDPPFVMATVVTVEHDAPGLASGHHDDLILEQHRHSERADVERLRRSKVGEVPRGFRTVHPLGWASGKVKYFVPSEEELLTGIQG